MIPGETTRVLAMRSGEIDLIPSRPGVARRARGRRRHRGQHADPFTTHLGAGLSNYLNERGYVLALQGVHHDGVAGATLLKSMRTDALCVLLSGTSGRRKEIIEPVHRMREPMITFQERAPIRDPDICSIRQDDRGGGRWLGSYLLERGARRLVFLAPRMVWPALSERERGIREAKASGSAAELRRVTYQGDFFVASQDALARHVDRHGPPDAVLSGNDQIGIAAMKFFQDRGLRVPEDVAVTGFNAFRFWQYASPVLTTVKSSAYELGMRGAEEILNRLETGRFASPDIILPVTPVVGAST